MRPEEEENLYNYKYTRVWIYLPVPKCCGAKRRFKNITENPGAPFPRKEEGNEGGERRESFVQRRRGGWALGPGPGPSAGISIRQGPQVGAHGLLPSEWRGTRRTRRPRLEARHQLTTQSSPSESAAEYARKIFLRIPRS